MKKILSVILAVMMLFGAFSVSSSAVSLTVDRDALSGVLNDDQVVVMYSLMGGTLRDPQLCYEENGWVEKSGISGTYVQLPYNDPNAFTVGSAILMPIVVAPSGMQFLYWEYFDASGIRHTVAAGGTLTVTDEMFNYPQYGVVKLTAVYTAAEPEEDTMATILNILIKVFGAIIGIVIYGGDTEAGVAFMEKVFGGLDL